MELSSLDTTRQQFRALEGGNDKERKGDENPRQPGAVNTLSLLQNQLANNHVRVRIFRQTTPIDPRV